MACQAREEQTSIINLYVLFDMGITHEKTILVPRNLKATNWDLFNEELKGRSWDLPSRLAYAHEINIAVNQMTEALTEIFEGSCPVRS